MAGWNSDSRHPRQENLSQSGGIGPLTGHGQSHYTTGAVGLERGRGDLILMLGILSLFLCGPLGIVAWVMANSDLTHLDSDAQFADQHLDKLSEIDPSVRGKKERIFTAVE